MTYMASVEAGMAMAFPDVCKTPVPPGAPVPVPYPNVSLLTNATEVSTKVSVVSAAVVTKISKIAVTEGDEAGVANGVVSNSIKKECKFVGSASSVFVQGKPVVRLGDAHTGNAQNAFGNITQPSQLKVTAN
jgi:hypothetical protein